MEGSTRGGGCGVPQSIAFEIHKTKNFTAPDTLQYPKQPSPLCPPLPPFLDFHLSTFGVPALEFHNMPTNVTPTLPLHKKITLEFSLMKHSYNC